MQFEEACARFQELADGEHERAGTRNEATTRLHLIDRLLFDCLGWDREDCTAEERLDAKYADYALSSPHRVLIVEAKREGDYFELPAGQLVRSPRVPIRYFEHTNDSAFRAIRQCIEYCMARGTSFGAVCNGHQIIAFIGSRLDGVAPMDGDALVFDSLAAARSNFQLLWDCLSKPGVLAQGLAKTLSQPVAAPPPSKLSERIPGYPGYRARTQHQADLQILGDLIIEDVVHVAGNEREFFAKTYCANGALSQYAVISKAILRARYSALEGPHGDLSLAAATDKAGNPNDQLLARTVSRRPVLLIGDVGVGKTTFIKHLIEVEGVEELRNAVVLYIDLGGEPTLARELPRVVCEAISNQLRKHYSIDIDEDRFVRGVYHGDLARFERGIHGPLKGSRPDLYLLKELEFLESLVADRERHVERSVEHIERGHKRQVVVFLDNVDQRPDEFQQETFLIGATMAANWSATVFISLRPETFHRSRQTGALSGYHARAFTIAPPRLDQVIRKRLEYAAEVANRGALDSLKFVTLRVPTITSFMEILAQSFDRRPELIEFCENMCGGNIRRGLDFIRTFVGSPHVDADQMLKYYTEQGRYFIPMHDFLRAVMFGDYELYDPGKSELVNVFDITMPDRKEHFLIPVLLAEAHALRSSHADGYVPIISLYDFAQNLGFLPGQIQTAIAKCLARRLLELPSRRSEGFMLEGRDTQMTYCRVTMAGAYYIQRLVSSFTYFDGIIVDLPCVDPAKRAEITIVGNMRDRLRRSEAVLAYLDDCWLDVRKAQDLFDWPAAATALRSEVAEIRERFRPLPNH